MSKLGDATQRRVEEELRKSELEAKPQYIETNEFQIARANELSTRGWSIYAADSMFDPDGSYGSQCWAEKNVQQVYVVRGKKYVGEPALLESFKNKNAYPAGDSYCLAFQTLPSGQKTWNTLHTVWNEQEHKFTVTQMPTLELFEPRHPHVLIGTPVTV
jgi:hypothetical protein